MSRTRRGYPDGFDVTMRTFTTSPRAELPLMAEAAAIYWADVGITATIQPADWPTVRSDWTSGAALVYVFADRGFLWPSTKIDLDAACVDSSIFASFTREVLESMMADMRETLDLDALRAKLTAIGQYLRDQAAAGGEDALRKVMSRVPASLSLAGVALTFTLIVGVLLGVFAAVTRGTPFDILTRLIALLGSRCRTSGRGSC